MITAVNPMHPPGTHHYLVVLRPPGQDSRIRYLDDLLDDLRRNRTADQYNDDAALRPVLIAAMREEYAESGTRWWLYEMVPSLLASHKG